MDFANITIGLISPSSPLSTGRLKATADFFKNLEFNIKIGKNNKKADRFLAGTDEERASDIMDFFKDDSVNVLVVTAGGAGSIRTLPLLDYDIIKKNPKPIIGFSDTTALQLGIYAKTANQSYTGFTGRDTIQSREVNILQQNTLMSCINNENYQIKQGQSINPGVAIAPLIGGNLKSITNLIGTPYQPNFNNKILFIEDVWTEPYVIDGLFSKLYLSGVFDGIAGLVLGQFNKCEAKIMPNRDGDMNDLIKDWSKKIKVPSIYNFPYGHYYSRCVLPIGQLAKLDAKQCSLEILFD